MSHYFDRQQQQVAPKKESTMTVTLRGQKITLTSASGMFSVGKLDRGAQVLVEYADIRDGQTILDLGSSYGTVGVALAKVAEVEVTLLEINKRAIKYAKMNVKQNGVERKCAVVHSDGFEKISDEVFDVVLFNPPQHAGKELCLSLIKESKEHLRVGGNLQLVCRHNVGGAQFEKYMGELFGSVETLCRKSGYRVYKSVKK